MDIINNVQTTLAEDLRTTLTRGSRMSIATSCFSIYAYQELRQELEEIEELRFIFTSPTFITDKENKEQREFYIPRLNRERSLTGSEFEIRLRNELTQKAIARECADWIRRKDILRIECKIRKEKSLRKEMELRCKSNQLRKLLK